MIVTGESESRLSELKKYTTTGDFFNQYKLSSGSSVDGVDKNLSNLNSNPVKIVYYIGGITYTDTILSPIIIEDDNDYYYGTGNQPIGLGNISDELITTKFSFTGQGYNSPDFVNYPIIKNPNEYNLVEHPKINSDVFIVRQDISVFNKNYKLRDIRSLVELVSYAGNKFFNIIDNT